MPFVLPRSISSLVFFAAVAASPASIAPVACGQMSRGAICSGDGAAALLARRLFLLGSSLHRFLRRLLRLRRRGPRGHRIAGRLDLVPELFAKVSLGREDALVGDLQLFRLVVFRHLTRV